ncbi:unnamed protein product [Linum trigynum]|uniref:Uncharacterized protein n=1 Tax=Linum trigynum TaxID=586398 RepID=A0AAV2E9U3_9ROSI
MTVGETRRPRGLHSQQYGEDVHLTKPDQSGQAMPHGQLGKTKAPRSLNTPPRVKTDSDFPCHDPMAKMKPNRARGFSNKDVRAGRTRELPSNIDFKSSQLCVKPTVMSHEIYGWLVWFDRWSWQWVWTFGRMVYAPVDPAFV